MNGQCRAGQRAFWDSVSCRKYTEVNSCVVRGVKYRTDYFSKNVRATSDLVNITNCPSALLFIPPGCLWEQNLAGKFVKFDHTCTTAHYFSLCTFVSCFSTHLLCFVAVP